MFGFFPMMFVFLWSDSMFWFQLNSPSDIDGCVCCCMLGRCFFISVTVSLRLNIYLAGS